jgi:hypothetical protein
MRPVMFSADLVKVGGQKEFGAKCLCYAIPNSAAQAMALGISAWLLNGQVVRLKRCPHNFCRVALRDS